jgi:hypothetical protein
MLSHENRFTDQNHTKKDQKKQKKNTRDKALCAITRMHQAGEGRALVA